MKITQRAHHEAILRAWLVKHVSRVTNIVMFSAKRTNFLATERAENAKPSVVVMLSAAFRVTTATYHDNSQINFRYHCRLHEGQLQLAY